MAIANPWEGQAQGDLKKMMGVSGWKIGSEAWTPQYLERKSNFWVAENCAKLAAPHSYRRKMVKEYASFVYSKLKEPVPVTAAAAVVAA